MKEKLEKLKKLADAMYYAAQYLTTDASRLHKAMDEYHQFVINEYHNEESVSEYLNTAARKYAGIPEDSPHDLKYCVQDKKEKYDAVLYGAKWQKSKDTKLIINAKDDGYRLGLATMKQQMMAKAVDIEVKIDAGGYPYIPQMELYDYDKDMPLAKEGDKYKVILIKED